MKKFRTSGRNQKHDSAKPVQVSIPQKDAIAIEPPKKVIKALYEWAGKDDPSVYLPFSQGDFLHVVSREDDTDWYEACNPLRNERGLVPVAFFEEVGKTNKTVSGSGSSVKSGGSNTHDSGYGEGSTPPAGAIHNMRQSNGISLPGHRSTRSISKASGGLYGIVSYDFHAERPDELDAKEGEAIIVIAQSNPEWFVAKPITRLGGPGLIPVSFIEIKDMTTGKTVDDPAAAVLKAGIPRVEEWKKMAAEYKNTSIPLGTVSGRNVQSMQNGMDRMSLGGGQQTGHGHSRQPSNSYVHQQQQQKLWAPVRASVPRYLFADDKFHFIVECRLANGSHWDLSRIYEDFYELQINLINAFQEESGQIPGKPRILPYMPGPVKFVTDNISEGRRTSLDEYLRDLLRLEPHIVNSSLVRNFFAPREGDFEVDPTAIDVNEHARPTNTSRDRHSQASQHSHSNSVYQQQAQSRQSPANQTPAQHAYTQSQASNGPYGHHRPQLSQQNASFTSQSTINTTNMSSSSIAGPPRQQTNMTSSTTASSVHSTVPVKVKAWFDRDTCVVIRMPPRGQFTYQDLYQKIAERRRLEYKAKTQGEEPLYIEYRDDKDGDYYRIEGNEDLDVAVERNEKLTIAVRVGDLTEQAAGK